MLELQESPAFSTFRDPAGSVVIQPDGVYRRVHAPYDAEALAFLESPLAASLAEQGRLIASEILVPGADGDALLLRHPRVGFSAYPWEWSPAMWRSAAELTLELCDELVSQGWILKDATPLNVLFEGPHPVFVDLLSICPMDPGVPMWYAYGQFVRTFLLPLLAYAELGWPLQASILRRDGYEPEEIYSVLPWRTRLRQPALSAVTLPRVMSRIDSRVGSKVGGKPASGLGAGFARDPEIARQVVRKTLGSLLRHVRAVTPAPAESIWSGYAQTATHYSDGEHVAKREFVAQALEAIAPRRVLDVGCNTGAYSDLAADAGAEVVAVDTDLQSVDRLYAQCRASGKHILPLCVDIARPTPAVGWRNQENSSFLDRCSGSFDTVMMLAVIHHLLVGSQIPLDRIAALSHAITTRHLIVEWVPLSDPKFREILRGRDALYAHLTEAAFREAFGQHFRVEREAALSNGRVLFHLAKR